ncbi:MAG TPA: hypothetical protein VFB62_18785 [Polyangiaceae bacterium]|jgi:hypothetical protein|nr:hypothetical protein [Polyangiaceae bacterium]
MKKVARIALSIAVVSIAACANEVHRDPSQSGAKLEGGDGSGGGANSGGSSAQPVCGAPAPALPLSDGSGTAVTSTGSGPDYCIHMIQDGAGHTWEAECTAAGCSCLLDDVELCSCQNDPASSVCDAVDNCCPSGWPRL